MPHTYIADAAFCACHCCWCWCWYTFSFAWFLLMDTQKFHLPNVHLHCISVVVHKLGWQVFDHLPPIVDIFYLINHRLRTPREEIAFTARPKIQSQPQIFRYGRSIFCLPHRPNFSDIFDLCLLWVSVVRAANNATTTNWMLRLLHGTATAIRV